MAAVWSPATASMPPYAPTPPVISRMRARGDVLRGAAQHVVRAEGGQLARLLRAAHDVDGADAHVARHLDDLAAQHRAAEPAAICSRQPPAGTASQLDHHERRHGVGHPSSCAAASSASHALRDGDAVLRAHQHVVRPGVAAAL